MSCVGQKEGVLVLSQIEYERIWDSLVGENGDLPKLTLSLEFTGQYERGHPAYLLLNGRKEGWDVIVGDFYDFRVDLDTVRAFEEVEDRFLPVGLGDQPTWSALLDATAGSESEDEMPMWVDEFYLQCLGPLEHHRSREASEQSMSDCLAFKNNPDPYIPWLGSFHQTRWPGLVPPNIKWALSGGLRDRWWFDEEDKELAEEHGIKGGIVSRYFQVSGGGRLDFSAPYFRGGSPNCYPTDVFEFLGVIDESLSGRLVLREPGFVRELTVDPVTAAELIGGLWAHGG